MTFKQLKVGDRFRFAQRSGAGIAAFNNYAVKLTPKLYRLGGEQRIIGNPEIEVLKMQKDKKSI